MLVTQSRSRRLCFVLASLSIFGLLPTREEVCTSQKHRQTTVAFAEAYRVARERMVKWQIEARGVRNARVLAAMRKVPRHLFVPPDQQPQAYADQPLPIGYRQTISQPYVVAFMTEALELRPEDRVLEIGTGSGYQAAVLAEVAKEVYTIEIIPERIWRRS